MNEADLKSVCTTVGTTAGSLLTLTLKSNLSIAEHIFNANTS
jgi:hypothetical protein